MSTKALLLLTFDSVEQAEHFATLITLQTEVTPIVTTGEAYYYKYEVDETTKIQQVVELPLTSRWESFEHGEDGHVVLVRDVLDE